MSIKVGDLLGEGCQFLRLVLVAGRKGLNKRITDHRVQKYGLALAGHYKFLRPNRIQIYGAAELSYLEGLPDSRQREVIGEICKFPLKCLIITGGREAPYALRQQAEQRGIALLRTELNSATFINLLSSYLERLLAPVECVHGVLADVNGVGVLIMGKSGIGKSECALHLVMKGHKLIADDLVVVRKKGGALVGSGTEAFKHHMEIRGLGIINIKNLFGISSVMDEKNIDLVVILEEWNQQEDNSPIIAEDKKWSLLGIELPCVKTPVKPGRSMPTIVEVAARKEGLQSRGELGTDYFWEPQLHRPSASKKGSAQRRRLRRRGA